MAELTEGRLGFGFGLIGGLLFLVGALVALGVGIVELAAGRYNGAVASWAETVLLFVFGGLAIFFAYIGDHEWKARPFAAGLLLLVIGVLGWASVGLGASLLGIIGGVFVVLAGVLYMVQPMSQAFRTAITS